MKSRKKTRKFGNSTNIFKEFIDTIPMTSSMKRYLNDNVIPEIEKNFVNESRLKTLKQKFINWFLTSKIGKRMLENDKWRIFLISFIK